MKTNIFFNRFFSRCPRFIGAVMMVVLMIPPITFPQGTAPPLGTAANFGVLAQAAISGTSVVVGNVGTLSATIAGTITAPGYTVYPVNDPVVQTANADLFTAYNDAAGQNPFTTVSGGLLSGTLTAGVYRLSALPSNLTGTITLDGGGVFIFQASSTLITSDGSSVLLTNGTVWSDVYWQVGSSATLAANSTFKGTILANTTITVGATASVTGRILAGAVTTNGVVTIGSNVLPVELISFTAALNNNKSTVELNWKTASEVNNFGFEIERSKDNNDFEKIGFVKGSGNSNSAKDYSFTDEQMLSGKYFYRLKQIDNDGIFKYSKVVEVDFTQPLTFELSQNYPNPFNPTTKISYSIPVDGRVQLLVYRITGELVRSLVSEYQTAGIYTIDFDAAGLSSGIYFYKITANDFLQIKKMSIIK